MARASATAGGEPALRARDGKVHPVHVNSAPIVDADGELTGAVLVLREAAAQRQAERAMREAYTELDERVVRRTAALELEHDRIAWFQPVELCPKILESEYGQLIHGIDDVTGIETAISRADGAGDRRDNHNARVGAQCGHHFGDL